jgi:hypothetical protein
MQLGLEVVDVALSSDQLILGILHLGVSVIEEVRLHVATAIGPHQLIVQLLDARFQTVVLLKKLAVTVLDVLDEAVLGRHLVVILLQVLALVGTNHYDLLEHGAHVLGVPCHEHPPHVVRRTLGVTHSGQALTPRHVAFILNREQGNGVASKARQVALIELHEDLLGSPLHGVIEVIAGGHGEPGRHARVEWVSRDIHMDLAASIPKLTVQATTVCGSPNVAEMVEHVPEQGQKSPDGATRHNGANRRPRGWRSGSRPSVKNKEEMNHHFIH